MNFAIITFSNPSSPPAKSPAMLSNLPTAPSTPEPEGWDAAHILQLVNPTTGKWSCPTVTKKNCRCKNVVSQERSIKVSSMINSMSVEDASVIVRDHNQELTGLAQTMICPRHSQCSDSKERVQGVVAQWKNLIKTSIRQQANPRPMHTNAKALTADFQPTTNGSRGRLFDAFPTVPKVEPRVQNTASGTSSPPQYTPLSSNSTIDGDATKEIMQALKDMTLQNAQFRDQNAQLREQNKKLRDENKKLRDENAQLAEKRDAAAREAKRARGELEAAEKERDVLDEQVNEQFREINELRDQAEVQKERISSLQNTPQKTTGAYGRLKQVWTAASVVPKPARSV